MLRPPSPSLVHLNHHHHLAAKRLLGIVGGSNGQRVNNDKTAVGPATHGSLPISAVRGPSGLLEDQPVPATAVETAAGRRRHRTRFNVALLGLAIAVVNCYAQATFCIAIVEMVLPADYVFKGGEPSSGGVESVVVEVKVVANGIRSAGQPTAIVGGGALADPGLTHGDQSCPVEYKYRDYYDSWRFPPSADTMNSSLGGDSSPSPPPTAASENMQFDISDRFDWDASRQGLLLGAFAVGTAPLQVLGGRLAEIYGAKWVLLAGCIGTAITNLTIPLLAHFSFVLLILNRVLMGVAQAGMEPGLMCLLADWLTPAETGFFISMLLFAICIGFFLGSLCSSFLLTLGYGWAITYYVAGGVNLAVGLLWLLYSSSRPRESSRISSEELEYLERAQQVAKAAEVAAKNRRTAAERNNDLNNNNNNNKTHSRHNGGTGGEDLGEEERRAELGLNWKRNISSSRHANGTAIYHDAGGKKGLEEGGEGRIIDEEQEEVEENDDVQRGQAPWMNILSTRSVWAFIICKISIRWCADVLSIELPTYLANVLHLSIKLNGILNSVSSALFAIFSFITGYLVNEISTREVTTRLPSGQLAPTQSEKKRVGISKTNLRKLFQSVASFGSAIAVFLMTQYDCNILFSMSMLLVLSCCLVMGTGGELQIPYDMTSKYPGTLHGMACTMSVSGWLAPPLIGLILGDQPSSRHRWSIVWYLTAFINFIGGLVFVLFADASPRDFDRRQRRRRRLTSKITTGGEQSPDRGRHSAASYYNVACKPADNSPPRAVRRPHLESSSSTVANGSCGKPISSNSSRERHVEEGLMGSGPSYLAPVIDDGSMFGGAQTAFIFPYRQKLHTTPEQRRQQAAEDVHCTTSRPVAAAATSAIRNSWLRLIGRRRKFSVPPMERGAPTISSVAPHDSSSGFDLASAANDNDNDHNICFCYPETLVLSSDNSPYDLAASRQLRCQPTGELGASRSAWRCLPAAGPAVVGLSAASVLATTRTITHL